MSAIAVPVAVAPARRRPWLRAILWAVDVAVFLGHKCAAFVYGHRLHVLSLFVFESGDEYR